MNRQDVVAAVRQAKKGSRKVRVTFRKDAQRDMDFLRGLMNSGRIFFDPGQDKIFNVGAWNDEASRTCIINLAPNFEEEWFVNQMAVAIEKIAVA